MDSAEPEESTKLPLFSSVQRMPDDHQKKKNWVVLAFGDL